jgi:hypothetical protein
MEITKPGLAVTYGSSSLHFWTYPNEAARTKAIQMMPPTASSVETCDVRTLEWATPNRVKINSGCKAFDKQCQGITTGNFIANTFLSLYIRPRAQTECNGFQNPPGHLQEFDLLPFARPDLHMRSAMDFIRKLPLAQTQSLLLTAVFHTSRDRQGRTILVVHGAVLTDTMLRLIRRFERYELGMYRKAKSYRIMETVTPFLTDQRATNRIPVVLH